MKTQATWIPIAYCWTTGNVFVCRLPSEVSDDIEDDPTGAKLKLQQGKLNGAPNKVEECIQYHVGEVITSLQKTTLVAAGAQLLVYGTIMGGIGVLLPLVRPSFLPLQIDAINRFLGKTLIFFHIWRCT